MDLREQVIQFREMLLQSGMQVDDFELNVNSDAFKELLSGGAGSLEVRYRPSGIAIDYQYDGTASWLETLADDLAKEAFQGSE